LVIFAPRKNNRIFIWQLQKYFLSLQLSNVENLFSNKGEMISSPELIYFDGLIFMPIMQFNCNENMADAFHVI
jgi:hypothetical protein